MQNPAKIQPYDELAEKSVLALMILENDTINEAVEYISPQDFYFSRNQIIAKAIFDLAENGKSVDLVTITDYLKDKGLLEEAGGETYLSEIVDFVPASSDISQYCEIIRKHHRRRAIIQVAREIIDRAYSTADNIEELADFAEKKMLEVTFQDRHESYVSLGEIINDIAYKIGEGQVELGLKTGFPTLDDMTAGFQAGDLIIIAGRPSTGKTSLALNITLNAARNGKKVMIFSTEMNRIELSHRFIAMASDVSLMNIRKGTLNDNDFDRILEGLEMIKGENILIDDTVSTIAEIRARARRAKSKEKQLDLIIVDHLQHISAYGHGQTRNEELGYISRSLKSLAGELQIPIIAVSQLSRNVEHRTNKKPVLADLRESGAIEQDADIVMFVFIDETKDVNKDPTNSTRIVDLIIAKHRNGPTGSIQMAFRKEFVKFGEIENRFNEE